MTLSPRLSTHDGPNTTQVASTLTPDDDGSQEERRMTLVNHLRAEVWKRDNSSRQDDDKVDEVHAESEDKRGMLGRMMGIERQLDDDERESMGVAKLFSMFAPGSAAYEKLEKELRKRQKDNANIKLEMLSLFSVAGTASKIPESKVIIDAELVQRLNKKKSFMTKVTRSPCLALALALAPALIVSILTLLTVILTSRCRQWTRSSRRISTRWSAPSSRWCSSPLPSSATCSSKWRSRRGGRRPSSIRQRRSHSATKPPP